MVLYNVIHQPMSKTNGVIVANADVQKGTTSPEFRIMRLCSSFKHGLKTFRDKGDLEPQTLESDDYDLMAVPSLKYKRADDMTE